MADVLLLPLRPGKKNPPAASSLVGGFLSFLCVCVACVRVALARAHDRLCLCFFDSVFYTVNITHKEVFMATSSITHNFTISTSKGVEQFLSAVESAEKDISAKKTETVGVLLSSPVEILKLMSKRGGNGR